MAFLYIRKYVKDVIQFYVKSIAAWHEEKYRDELMTTDLIRDFIDLIDISNLIFVFVKTITSGAFDGIK